MKNRIDLSVLATLLSLAACGGAAEPAAEPAAPAAPTPTAPAEETPAPPETPATPPAPPAPTVDARALLELPAPTFLESIALSPAGPFLVTNFPEGTIFALDAAGSPTPWAKIPGTVAGVIPLCGGDGSALASGWEKGKVPAVFSVSKTGKVKKLLTLKGGMFPNGWAHLGGTRYLLADSYKGAIWVIDQKKKSAKIWLEDQSLARSDPKSSYPAVNGLKRFGDALYASNTERKQIIKIPLDGDKPGTPEVFAQNQNVDDFAFDASGNLYGTTHVLDSVIRIAPDGTATEVAGRAQGLAGSTALAFGRDADATALFVTTNGGMSNPPEGGVQPGRVVRIEVGQPAAPVCF